MYTEQNHTLAQAIASVLFLPFRWAVGTACENRSTEHSETSVSTKGKPRMLNGLDENLGA